MQSDSLSAEVKLALYFQRLAEGERNVEAAREVLAKQYLFDPYGTFALLSNPIRNRITSYDLLKFARYASHKHYRVVPTTLPLSRRRSSISFATTARTITEKCRTPSKFPHTNPGVVS